MVVKCDNERYPEEVYAPEAQFRPTPIGRALALQAEFEAPYFPQSV